MIVECLRSQFGMQLTRLTIHTRPVIVKDTIGHIRRLLHLGQQDTGTDSMHTSSRQVEHITRLYLMTGEHIRYRAIGDILFISLGGYLLLESGIEITPRLSIDNIPHLTLSHLAMLTLSHLIIRMNLNA